MLGIVHQPATGSSQRSLRGHALLAVLFLFVVLSAHGGSFHGEFFFDDQGAIQDNTSIHVLSSFSKVLSEAEYTTVAGRPLLNLSLAVNYALGGLHPEGYRVVNYLIHAATGYVLFLLLCRVLILFADTRAAAVPLALMISLLWCIHPLTINGVSYIVQRAESITSFFYLIVLWSFAKGIQTEQRRWFVLSMVAAWLGALTKEIIATVPLTVIAFDALVFTRDWRMAWHRHWRVYLALFSAWIPLGLCMWASKGREGTVGFGRGVTLQEHLQTQVWAIAQYLRLVVWPQPIIFDYGDRFVVTDVTQVMIAIGVVLAFGGFVLWLLVRRSPLAFLGVLLGLLLAPTTVIPIATQTVAEHRMYLASASVITLIVLVSYLGLSRVPRLSSARVVTPSVVLGSVLVPVTLLLLLVTVRHTRVFLTNDSLWADTFQKLPSNMRAAIGVAEARFRANDDATAERLGNQVIESNSKFAVNAYVLRGRIVERRGDFQKALDDFTQAIALCPSRRKYAMCDAYEHRAQVFLQQREFQKAIDDFAQAIRIRPKVIKYHHQQAIALRDAGHYDDALQELDQAEGIEPQNLNTDILRGSIGLVRGDLDLALASFDRILAQESAHVVARRSRARVLAQMNRWSDALVEIRRLQQEGRRVDEKLVHDVEQHFANHEHEKM